MKENKIKLFVAIPIPDALNNCLEKFIELNSDVNNIRWTPGENRHITLFFIGFINENKTDKMINKINDIISTHNSFSLYFDRFSLEGKPSRSSMIWCRYQFSESFSLISNEIANVLKEDLEKIQNFKRAIPHITLARLRKSVKRMEIKLDSKPESTELNVSCCQLWQSIGTTSGMIYKNLFEFTFKN